MLFHHSRDNLNLEVLKLENVLTNFACPAREIPRAIHKIERYYQQILESDWSLVKQGKIHCGIGETRKIERIFNKYFEFKRLDEQDYKELPGIGKIVDTPDVKHQPVTQDLARALNFNKKKDAYVARVKDFMHKLHAALGDRQFHEKRMAWVHEEEHQPYWLERQWDVHTPWEMRKVENILKDFDKPESRSDDEYLKAFVKIVDLFHRAIKPSPSLLRGKMEKLTAEFYREQIGKINELSFEAPTPPAVVCKMEA